MQTQATAGKRSSAERIAIIGTGNVAKALAAGFAQAGHQVQLGSRDPSDARSKAAKLPDGVSMATQREAVAFGDVVFLAIPYVALKETIQAIGPETLREKVVVDVTNVLTSSYKWALGFSTSGVEELAKILPGSRVVKGFNTIFAENMRTGRIGRHELAALIASDDAEAKRRVLRLAKDIGFDAIDAGPLESARYLEAMGLQTIRLGYDLKMGAGIGFTLIRSGVAESASGAPGPEERHPRPPGRGSV